MTKGSVGAYVKAPQNARRSGKVNESDPELDFAFDNYTKFVTQQIVASNDRSTKPKKRNKRQRLDKMEKMADLLSQDEADKDKPNTVTKITEWFKSKTNVVGVPSPAKTTKVTSVNSNRSESPQSDDDYDNDNDSEHVVDIPEPDNEEPSEDDSGEAVEPRKKPERRKSSEDKLRYTPFTSKSAKDEILPLIVDNSEDREDSRCNCTNLWMLIPIVLVLVLLAAGSLLMGHESLDTNQKALGAILLWVAAIIGVVSCFMPVLLGAGPEMYRRGERVSHSDHIHHPHRGFPLGGNRVDEKSPSSRWNLVRINDRYGDSTQKDRIYHSTIASLSAENQRLLKDYVHQEQAKKAAQETQRLIQMEERLREAIAKKSPLKEVYSRMKPCVFKIEFNADSVEHLREKISWIISIGTSYDEVVIVLMSPGGPVAHYGLAASQLKRIKNAGMKLTVCVDLMAASGGYMMACVGDEICAAPFSYIGSIGVVAAIQNHEEFLNHWGVYNHVFTAGEYKRTVNSVGQMTEEGKAKFKQELEAIHEAFKAHVANERGDKITDIDAIATGEDWLAVDALNHGLVDRICTSDEWLLEKAKTFDVLELVETEQYHAHSVHMHEMSLGNLLAQVFKKEKYGHLWEKIKTVLNTTINDKNQSTREHGMLAPLQKKTVM